MNIAAGTVHSPAGWAHFIGVIMGNSGKGVGMVTWADADAAVEAERVNAFEGGKHGPANSSFPLGVRRMARMAFHQGPDERRRCRVDQFWSASAVDLGDLCSRRPLMTLSHVRGSHRPPPLHGQFFSAWVLWVLMTALSTGQQPDDVLQGSRITFSHRTMRGHFGVLRFRAILTGIGSALPQATVTQTSDF